MPLSLNTTTTTALLDGLHDRENRAVWEEFDARYRPIILACARRLGLNHDESADVAQEALAGFLTAYTAGKFDRTKGRLRSWLIGMVKRRAVDLVREKSRRRETGGESHLASAPQDNGLDEIWAAERRAELLRRALVELRETTRTSDKTLRAFELFVLQGRGAAETAAELEITPQAVYVAKNRVADQLRGILVRLEQLYDDG